jgi:cell division protein FtsN
MKQNDFNKKSSVFFIGKGVIILSIITISSLSFVLGFFVGKNYGPSAENHTPTVSLQDSAVQKEKAAEVTPALPIQTTVQNQDTNQLVVYQDRKQSQEIQRAETVQNKDPQQNIQPKSTEKPKIKQDDKEPEDNLEPNKSSKTSKARKYTLQAGAFKNASEADALKSKLEKKGYKISVKATKSKGHEKLYKVLVGEFKTRKEAELLAVKMKKSEGLHPFVTFKTH